MSSGGGPSGRSSGGGSSGGSSGAGSSGRSSGVVDQVAGAQVVVNQVARVQVWWIKWREFR